MQLFEHIQVFGRPGIYIVRLDNDADNETRFTSWDSAVLFVCEHLAARRHEPGIRDAAETHVKVTPHG